MLSDLSASREECLPGLVSKRALTERLCPEIQDILVSPDDKNRVLVYSFDGQLKGTVAGHSPSVSAKADLLTVKIESGELELYDLVTMQKRSTYNFPNRVAFNGFGDDGRRLLVLTGDQVVYVLDPAAIPATDKVASR